MELPIEIFRENLKRICAEKRGRQKDIANFLSERQNTYVKPNQISEIISGIRGCSEKRMFLICEYLNIPYAEMVTRKSISRASPQIDKDELIKLIDQKCEELKNELNKKITEKVNPVDNADETLIKENHTFVK